MTDTTTPRPWDELRDERGEPRPAAAEVLARHRPPRRRGAAGPPGRGGRRHPHDGHHVHRVLRRAPSIDRAWPFDVIPRIIEAGEWAARRARPRAAAARAQPVHRRRLQRPADRRRRRVPRRPARRLGELPPRVPGRPPEVRGVGAHLAAPTSSATPTARCTCSRTTCACRRASATCSRTGPSPSGRSPRCSPARASPRSTPTPTSSTSCSCRWRPTASPTRRSPCSRRASSTRPTSSTRSSPSGWAPRSSRAATSSSATTTACTCARSTGLEPVDVDLPPHRRPVPRPRGVPPRLDARRARA